MARVRARAQEAGEALRGPRSGGHAASLSRSAAAPAARRRCAGRSPVEFFAGAVEAVRARLADGAGHAGDRGKVERLLDGAPVVLADEDGVAAPPGDGQRLGLVVDLIDDAVEMSAGGGCRYSGHSKSVR